MKWKKADKEPHPPYTAFLFLNLQIVHPPRKTLPFGSFTAEDLLLPLIP